MKLIRIRQEKDFSKSRASMIFERLIRAMDDVKNKGQNYIEIGDE